MTRKFTLSRRAFLRGSAGSIAIALPFLDAMRPSVAVADGGELPKRLVMFFTANGTQPGSWTPGPGFKLSPILSPLAPHRDDLLVLSGLDMKSSGGDKKGHNRGVGALWTGTQPKNGNDGDAGYAQSVSVDQYIASKVGAATPFASLELGVQVGFTIPRGRMIYSLAGDPVPPEENPTKAFNRLFGNFGQSEAAAQKEQGRRRTILDAVKRDFDDLNARLGVEDRQKLGGHLQAIRDIETRLDKLTTTPAGCDPKAPGYVNQKDKSKFPEVGELMMDVLVMALACDRTRVASLMWSSALSSVVHTWLGHTTGHHSFSHSLNDPNSVAQIVAINTWYAERFGSLLDRMKQVQEGSGTLLDNSVVVWGSELGKGQPHYCTKIPFVLAGGCGGYFETGRHLSFSGRSHNDLLVSLMHAMGVQEQSFGDPNHSKGPIAELVA